MPSVETIYKEISKLSIGEKRLILSKLISEIPILKNTDKLNIYDLKGVGKDIWKGVDAQEYVNQERNSWE